ncbi:acyltransferase [Jannaschia sp. S6380]|uniref:acyltransferase family protein n=1 Tax=Jannaschia sp. S6380 TaxID=2926408 RepID=UPI001FF20DCE|nr:acyltransferase family protein [Jannaschia sp. S6380]MCK0168494.1 acyltransferase [Jannaschia sp. S6380]
MSLSYRADIDGLRAVAVLPVLAFHFGQPWMPGGFVGVDVFFVISGFLITSIIQRELSAGTFSLLHFYERRIRRILPALFVVIAGSLAAATVVFLPHHLRDAGQSAVAATVFASNILFWLEAGYFDAAAYTKPLLHTWSLAIEEQFYLFVPLVLMALARLGRRPVFWIGGLTLASFVLSALTTATVPTAAYYLLPWRAWELGVGALLALGLVPAFGGRALREGAALLGLVMILLAAVILDKGTAFPGVAAALPVLGTALVLHAGASGGTRIGGLLGSTLPVWIGRRSYSLYLWHWPAVVFFLYVFLDMPDPLEALGLFALSLLLADLSFRFVERPFRRPTFGSRRTVFAGAGAAMVAVIAIGLVPVVGTGLPFRLPPEAKLLAAFAEDRHAAARACERRQNGKDWSEPCLFGAPAGGPAPVVLLGDSHGPAYVPALDLAGQELGLTVEMLAHRGCPNFPDFQVYWIGEEHDCGPYVDTTFERVLADPDVELVIYTLRAQLYAQGWPDYSLTERNRSPLLIGPRAGPLPDGADRTAFYLDRLDAAVGRLRASGKQVLLVYPLPEAEQHVPEAAARALVRGGDPGDLSIARTRFDDRTATIIAGYDEIVQRHDLLALRIDGILCDETVCDLLLEDVPLFRDTNHLTETAARLLAPRFVQVLRDAQVAR